MKEIPVGQAPQSSYTAAVAELVAIRDLLVPGRVGPEDVERLAAAAARAAATARASLLRAHAAVDLLRDDTSGL